MASDAEASKNDGYPWEVVFIGSRTFLNVGETLYEVLALSPTDAEDGDEIGTALSQHTVPNPTPQLGPNLPVISHLFPYRDMETGVIVVPGREHAKHSTPDVTLAVSALSLGLPWQPFVSASDRLRQEAVDHIAQARAKFGNGGAAISAAQNQDGKKNDKEDDKDDDMTWDQVRAGVLGGGGGEVPSAEDGAAARTNDDADDGNRGNDNDNDGSEEEQDRAAEKDSFGESAPLPLSSSRPEAPKRTANATATSRSAGDSFTGGYGVLAHGRPDDVPVLCIGGGAGPEKDGKDEDEDEDEHGQGVPVPMAVSSIPVTSSRPDSKADPTTGFLSAISRDAEAPDRTGVAAALAPAVNQDETAVVFLPTNVELDPETGRIAYRKDDSLHGLTAKQAELAQRRREATPTDATRRTQDSAQKAEYARVMANVEAERKSAPKGSALSLEKELRAFGLPADVVRATLASPASAAAGGAPSSHSEAASADYDEEEVEAEWPTSIDEVLPLAVPFKSAAVKAKEAREAKKEKAAATATSAASSATVATPLVAATTAAAPPPTVPETSPALSVFSSTPGSPVASAVPPSSAIGRSTAPPSPHLQFAIQLLRANERQCRAAADMAACTADWLATQMF